MEITVNEEWLRAFYEILVGIYKRTEDPITVGYSKAMIQVCVERPLTDIYSLTPFPHLLHKATILLETIIDFHPFADGNKRVALLATYYFLYWNGYDFAIPENAAEFTIEIAEGKHSLNAILSWLMKNCKRNPSSILRNKVFSICIKLSKDPIRLTSLIEMLTPMIIPSYPFAFFWERTKRKNRKSEQLFPAQ